MYNVKNEQLANAIEQKGEFSGVTPLYKMCIRSLSDGSLYLGDIMYSVSSDVQSTSLPEDIELGAVCSQQWMVELLDSGENKFIGGEYEISLYVRSRHSSLTYGDIKKHACSELKDWRIEQLAALGDAVCGEFIPMGICTCVKAPRTGSTRTLTLYDKLYFSDKQYNSKIRFPALASDVERDVCAQLGIECSWDYEYEELISDNGGNLLTEIGGSFLKTASFDFTISHKPQGYTMRQMLSYIASAKGQFGYVDRHGRYARKWYGIPSWTLDNNTLDEPTLSEKANRVVGIVCIVNENTTLSIGEMQGGRVIEFENPYMNESLLKTLFNRVRRLTWHTAAVQQRVGDPRMDIGDVVRYTDDKEQDYTIPITGLSFDFSGGLTASITSVGLNEDEQLI